MRNVPPSVISKKTIGLGAFAAFAGAVTGAAMVELVVGACAVCVAGCEEVGVRGAKLCASSVPCGCSFDPPQPIYSSVSVSYEESVTCDLSYVVGVVRG